MRTIDLLPNNHCFGCGFLALAFTFITNNTSTLLPCRPSPERQYFYKRKRQNVMFFRLTTLCMSLTILGTGADPLFVARDAARLHMGPFMHGKCVVEGRYTHNLDSFNVLENRQYHDQGEKWTERCRNCSCSAYGASCMGPVCDNLYDFSQDEWCIKWSEDGCCCEELGCTVDNETYPLYSQYPYGKGNPCLMCTCEIGATREYCLRQQCGHYSVVCENEEMTVDENCCPHYTCPTVPCSEIPDPNPDTDRHELLDWYGTIQPIAVGTTRHFHVDTWSTYVCECQNGPVATCHVEHY